MRARVATQTCVVILMVALAGCTHEANIGISVSNLTSETVIAHMQITDSTQVLMFNQTFTVAAKSLEEHPGKLNLRTGKYNISVDGDGKTEYRDFDIQSNVRGITAALGPDGWDIVVRVS